MRGALTFLGKFLVIAGLLYGVWELLAPFYLAMVAPTVNALFTLLQLPVQLELRGGILLLVYRLGGAPLRLEVQGYDIVYLNLITATALLAASPGKSFGWKLRWMGTVLVALWATHVASFFINGQIAIWQYLEGVQGQETLLASAREHFPLARRQILAQLMAHWNIWGRYALAVGVWFWAFHREIAERIPEMDRERSILPLVNVYRGSKSQVEGSTPQKAASKGSRRRNRRIQLKRAS